MMEVLFLQLDVDGSTTPAASIPLLSADHPPHHHHHITKAFDNMASAQCTNDHILSEYS